MKKLLFFFIIFVFGSITLFAQDYLMPISGSATYTTCSGNFYDDGGATNDYSTNVRGLITFYPSTPGSKLSVNFSSFNSSENQDFLYVYNGHDTTAAQIGKLTGPAGYGTITSSAADGSLTFKFTSDNSHLYGTESGWAATLSCSSAPPDTVTMLASGSVTTCGGYFYDGGGPSGDYMVGQHSVVTIYPSTPGSKLSVNFSSFNSSENQDFLYVYNGHDTTAAQIGKLTGPAGYGTITSSAADGSLTFKFTSDNSHLYGTESGWAATLSCSSAPPDTVTMLASGSVTTCGGYFYDGGGPSGDYMVGQHSVVTIYPSTPGSKLSVNFSSFNSSENQDFLYVYNGHDTTAAQIGKLTGPAGYGTITSSAADGSLTFKFTSDNSHLYGTESGWAATLSCSSAPPDTVTMLASGSVTTCGGYFYDGGGPSGDYMVGQHSVVTIYPSTPGSKLSVNFSSFNSSENQDFLYVYNGHDTTAAQIGKLTGPAGYGTITSSAADGSLTFKFTSDNSHLYGTESGWAATLSCSSAPPDTVTMLASGSVITCGGYFYDGGGPSGDYMVGQHSVVTIYPSTPGSKLSVNFSSFNSSENQDFLYVYNGHDTTAAQIGKLTGPAGYGTITSSAADGSLTFKFTSDNSHLYGTESGWAATLSCSSAPPDTVTMLASGSVTTCGGYFYDGGGPSGDYMVGQHSVVTIYPSTPGSKLSVNFSSFNSSENQDFLYVYNGHDTTAPNIDTLTGQTFSGIITSSAADGSLTFKFTSDKSHLYGTESGWVATLSCNITPYQSPNLPPSAAINSDGNQATTNEPIQLGTGTYYYKHTDINIPSINGTLNFTRFYNSLNDTISSSLGYGWSHTYNYYLTNRGDTAWDIHYPDGHLSTFIPMNPLGQSFPIFSGTTG